MTVKSALILCTGVAIGFFIGMDVDAGTKERINNAIKKKIYHVLTGEDMPKYPKHPVSYSSYYKRQKEEKNHD